MTLTVKLIPCLSDNYAWWVRDDSTGICAVVDPGEAAPVAAFLREQGCGLDWILLTHHHGDHIAGVAELLAEFGGKVAGAAADAHRLPPLDLALADGDDFLLGAAAARVIGTPGHTRGHIAIAFASHVFCGDTLFSLGCGRLLEGDAAEMFASLTALAALPDATLVCCGHEYTESNVRFALTVEPDNEALRARAEEVRAQRVVGMATVPTTIAQERAANPFMRAGSAARLAEIRAAKDSFRG
ncbi:MAG: hydroxyacylglutathione hydrolase [Alphaproteobacteria bacterium]|nr:hydroxyacylglutathione hydrolase [Alphaproteobacteria bacterium]